MTSFAFVTALAPVVRGFVGSTKAFTTTRIPSHARNFAPTRRCRTPTVALKAVMEPSEPSSSESEVPERFGEVMQQFVLSLLGVYAGLSGASPAAAVPEALVEAFTSTPVSLAHPVAMWTVLGTALYTFYLGYQSSLVRKSEPEKRKELIKGKFGDRHFRTSSALFAFMTLATFGGMANTYARTGKLFPGPHLYAGLGLVATMAVMSSFAPYMLKGKEWARNAHFTIAFLAIGLFGWQAKSGMVIVGKLLGWDE